MTVNLLDTHVWLWTTSATTELSKENRAFIARASDDGALCISAMSVWEVALLNQSGRLDLHKPLDAWINSATAVAGIRVMPVDASVALQANLLPGSFHKDPADRLIVATARQAGARLLTRDRKILDYGREGHVEVMAV